MNVLVRIALSRAGMLLTGCLLMLLPAQAQPSATVATDRSVYDYGEPVQIRYTIDNTTTDTLHLYGSGDCHAAFRFDDYDVSQWRICLAEEVIIRVPPDGSHTWLWEIEPHVLGLPATSGEHTIVGYYPGRPELRDTTSVRAPRYDGGELQVSFSGDLDPAALDPVKDSLNVVVLDSTASPGGDVRELWQISGVPLDTAYARYKDDSRFKSLHPNRMFYNQRVLSTRQQPLRGTSWELKAYGVPGEALEPVVPDPARSDGPYVVYFMEEGGLTHEHEDRGLRSSDGCNSQAAAYWTGASGEYATAEWVTTTASCGERNRDAEPFLNGLQRGESYKLIGEDSLTIYYEVEDTLRVLAFGPEAIRDEITEGAAAEELVLEAPYPNPFQEAVTLAYALPMAGPVRLALYDVLGREVARLVDERMPAGRHEVQMEAGGLAPGTYFVRLETPEGVQAQPLVVVR